MILHNLTPHAVNIFSYKDVNCDKRGVFTLTDDNASPILTLHSEGVARAAQREEVVGDLKVDGCAVVFEVLNMSYHEPVDLPAPQEPVDLPAPQEGHGYVVSFLTASAAKAHGRSTDDLYVVAHAVRNSSGQIVGCTSFSQV